MRFELHTLLVKKDDEGVGPFEIPKEEWVNFSGMKFRSFNETYYEVIFLKFIGADEEPDDGDEIDEQSATAAAFLATALESESLDEL